MRRFFLFFLSLAAAAVGALAWTRRDDLKRTWGEWQAATANAGKAERSGGPKVNGPVPGSDGARVAPPRPKAAANENAAPRCAAETRGGKRCSREVEPGSRFCWQHG